jgi:hypothetical protein
MIRTMRKSGDGRLGIPRVGAAAAACVLAVLLWTLVLAPAARADTTPTLTDTTTGSLTVAAVGDTVTLTPGTYTLDPKGIGFQEHWYDCSSAVPVVTLVGAAPTGCVAINPASASPYTVTSADQGAYITVYETDPTPSAPQVDQNASNTLAVPGPPPPPKNITRPSITGSATSGSTLSPNPGTWTGTGNTYAYGWFACEQGENNQLTGCALQGTGPSFQLSSSDVGLYIELTVTASNDGKNATATSSPFGPITAGSGTVPPSNPPPTGTGVPTVSGTPQVGGTLTGIPSDSSSYTFQWLRCSGQSCTAIPGAIDTTYSPVAADLGDTLVFSETGTTGATTQSAKTATVTSPTETTLQITPAGVVAGQTATLIATVTSATSQAPPLGAITFEHAGAPIPSCASIATKPSGASATVSCQTVFAGSASTLSAIFTPSPAAQVTGSDSTAVGFVLARAATAATMILPKQVTLGKRITFKAKIAPQAGTAGVSPTGSVVFFDGTKAIKGCAPTLARGVARCTVKYEALGRHSISATYLGDGNFSGSSTHVHTLAVVVPNPTGFVGSLMTWTFHFEPQYTQVAALTVTDVQPGLTISVRCSGTGCPKHRYVDTIKRAACGKHDRCKNVNLAKHFGGRKLDVGARVTVRLTHPGWLGKYYAFVVRHGRQPTIDTACLAVGEAQPGAGCTPR